MASRSLSIIIPCLNEAAEIAGALAALAAARARGVEIIVVDGGSSDETIRFAEAGADMVLCASRGRARQMNAGAMKARGDVLLFLHADTRLPLNGDILALESLTGSGRRWGRFDVTISGKHRLLRLVAAMMNWRSRWSGIATGDQAIFVARDVFEAVGRFPEIPLMEDVALATRLRRLARPLCLRNRVTTSGRGWERRGVLRTILLMWRLRLAYWLGARPQALAKRYVWNKPS